jgi:hypothetical protein
MEVSVGQRQAEAEACSLVHKGCFAKLAQEADRASAPQDSFPSRALLGRWNASAGSALSFVHWSGKTSLEGRVCKRKGASRKACA